MPDTNAKTPKFPVIKNAAELYEAIIASIDFDALEMQTGTTGRKYKTTRVNKASFTHDGRRDDVQITVNRYFDVGSKKAGELSREERRTINLVQAGKADKALITPAMKAKMQAEVEATNSYASLLEDVGDVGDADATGENADYAGEK